MCADCSSFRKINLKYIDFGLVDVFRDENGDHIKEVDGVTPKGTPNYMSRNAHKGKKLSRRDDLESVLYMILTLYNGYSPW